VSVYLLHSTVPLQRGNGQQVRHYLGHVQPGGLAHRLEEHRKGQHSAKVLDAMREKGATFLLGNFWPDRTREDERRMKANGHLSGQCLVCQLRAKTMEYDALLSRARASSATRTKPSNGRVLNSTGQSGGAAPAKTAGSLRPAPRTQYTVYRGRRWRYQLARRGTGASSATARPATRGTRPAGTRRSSG